MVASERLFLVWVMPLREQNQQNDSNVFRVPDEGVPDIYSPLPILKYLKGVCSASSWANITIGNVVDFVLLPLSNQE